MPPVQRRSLTGSNMNAATSVGERCTSVLGLTSTAMDIPLVSLRRFSLSVVAPAWVGLLLRWERSRTARWHTSATAVLGSRTDRRARRPGSRRGGPGGPRRQDRGRVPPTTKPTRLSLRRPGIRSLVGAAGVSALLRPGVAVSAVRAGVRIGKSGRWCAGKAGRRRVRPTAWRAMSRVTQSRQPTRPSLFRRGSWLEVRRIGEILRAETVGGVLLAAGAVLALVWANSPWRESYAALTELRVGPSALHLDLTLGQLGPGRVVGGLLLRGRAGAQA